MELLETCKTNMEELRYLALSYPPEHMLRLLCLYSQLYPMPTFYNRYEKEMLELMVGDYQNSRHIYNFHLLQKAGLMRNSKTKNRWEQIVQAYDLLPTEYHSYTKVFIKYSALSVRYIEMLIKGRLSPEANALLGRDNNYLAGLEKEGKKLKELYLFYVGGITYGEISCLRLLERELNVKIIIMTTKITNGIDLIKYNLDTMAL
jgi:hypothetical protein